MKNVYKQLEEMKTKNEGIKNDVIDYILYRSYDYDHIENVFKDLFYGGCQSGMVGHLISYHDTYNYFNNHYQEILTLIDEYEEVTGDKPIYKDDIKNDYAWFSFEYTAQKIADELELEI